MNVLPNGLPCINIHLRNIPDKQPKMLLLLLRNISYKANSFRMTNSTPKCISVKFLERPLNAKNMSIDIIVSKNITWVDV